MIQIRKTTATPEEKAAAGFEVLARFLPMMFTGRNRKDDDPFSEVPRKIAEYLRIEICSIYLIGRDSAGSECLELYDAYGYKPAAKKELKSLDRGLTAHIVNNKLCVVGNFNVQDRPNWTGQFDKLLEGHCWCLLGLPIIDARGNVKGAIKVENKQSEWTSQEGKNFLGAAAQRKNTPQQIRDAIAKVTNSVRSKVHKDKRRLVEQVELLAESLLTSCSELSTDFKYEEDSEIPAEQIQRLDASLQRKAIKAAEWYADALYEGLLILRQNVRAPNQRLFDHATTLLASFSLALKAYEPFDKVDLLMMRAVANMIAAYLDIQQAARVAELRQLQHGLRNETTLFLKCVDQIQRLTEKAWNKDGKLRAELGRLYDVALNISGPHDAIMGMKTSSASIAFGDFYNRSVKSRILYYQSCAKLFSKEFKVIGEDQISNLATPVFYADILKGVLDILFCNAIEHGGHEICLTFKLNGDSDIAITVSDNGEGIEESKLSSVERDSTNASERFDITSEKGRFGLRAARYAVEKAGYRLLWPEKTRTKRRKADFTLLIPTDQT
jgi:signal transduction histidine kinase